MATVRWLGPPEHEVGLIGFGTVSPGDVVELDGELAARLIKIGRAEEADADEDVADAPDNPDGSAATKTSHNAEVADKDSTPLATVPAGALDSDRNRALAPKDK